MSGAPGGVRRSARAAGSAAARPPAAAAPPTRGGRSPIPQAAPPRAGPPRRQAAPAPAAGSSRRRARPARAIWCRSRRSAARATRIAPSAACRQSFPELGDRQPIVIRRADLGSKGVFYRAMVGPFRSAHEASQFCSSYKAAGGQCVVLPELTDPRLTLGAARANPRR